MARTKTRPRRNPHLNKAISAGIGQAIATGNTGLIPQRMGLMDAINIATNRNRLAGFWGMRELPRDPLDDVPFGPNQPLTPDPIDPPNPRTGMPDPRIWEYQQSWNLPGNARREVPWQVLRASAIGVDIIRRCIEGRKKHVRTLQWSWSVRAQVVEDAYGRETRKGYEDVAAELRDRYAADINRLTEFWQHPWRTAPAGPWSFGQWINSVMEEYLTLDAICIYPRRSLAGDLIALEQVDGATIKPLLDHRGAMPQPPHPAYQQELFGFPRGEFAASFTVDEQGRKIIDNGYQAGELHYHRENTRVHSPYGLSAVEQALISARLYLKRQGWLLAEYDDGSTPLTMMEPPLDPALVATFTPEQRRMWEDAYNAEYAGQTAARHRIKVAPPGWKPHQLSSADERYKPAFDLHLIKLVAGHFGMTATELGFSEQQGLGSAGWAETQAEVQGRIGLKPDTQVLADIVNAVSRDFCNAPPELEFSFVDPASANDAESDQVATSQRTRGTITLNQDRRALKLPLYDFKEADMPFLVTATGPVFLEGAYERVQQQAEAAQMQAQATVEGTTGKLELEQAKLEDGRQAREEQREFTREQMQADTAKAATADQPHTGAMVALIPAPADAARLAVAGGEAADELHLTLLYLGKAADISEATRGRIAAALRSTVEDALQPDYDMPVQAEGFAVSMFNPGSPDRDPCIVLGVGGPDLEAVRDLCADTVGEVQNFGTGFALPKQHTPWIPHITLIYTDDADRVAALTDRVGPIIFDRLRVSFAGETVDIPLANPESAAKAAAAELAAFRTWRRRNPNPHRPFVFKSATPDDAPDLADLSPDVVAFPEPWEWAGDLEKYESWWPRDSRGRWVRRSHLGHAVVDALKEDDRTRRGVLTNAQISAMRDDELFNLFTQLSRQDTLDEDVVQRLVADMDRREQRDHDNPWLTSTPDSTPFGDLGEESEQSRRVDDALAGGADFLAAYAEAHQADETQLAHRAAGSMVDRRAGETTDRAVRRSYDEWVHVTYLQAEKATRGHMLNRAGHAAGIDPLELFTGPTSRARRYASEELMRWWQRNPRTTLTQFRAQVLRRQRDVQAARVTAMQSQGRDFL